MPDDRCDLLCLDLPRAERIRAHLDRETVEAAVPVSPPRVTHGHGQPKARRQMSISSGIRSRRTKIRLRRTLIALALFSVGAASGAGASLAADFPVTTTGDAGAGSLRQAIVDANAAAGADDIKFAIPGTGVKTINVTSDLLPEITGPVTINGYTQSGSSPNTKTRDQGTDTSCESRSAGNSAL